MKISVFALAVLALVFTSSVLGSKPTPDIAPTHAGFINVSPQDGAFLYYYFLESQNDPSTDPVFLWLQGGPGCSSLFGLFVENGPQIVDANGNFSPNPYSWTTNASMLWIDSPVGTGYSYVQNGDYARNEQTVSADLYTALYAFFFELYPQYSQNDFYVFGESYGGKYVPWLASTIITENGNAQNAINLKGIGMGDGWTDPLIQAGTYSTFLKANGLINSLEEDAAGPIYESYKLLVDAHLYAEADVVGNALLELMVAAAGNVDVYDIRYHNGDPTDPLQAALGTVLNRQDVMTLLNATGTTSGWTACADSPYFGLEGDIEQSSAFLIPGILAQIPVLIYNGNEDLICNYFGTNAWSDALNWPGQTAFQNAVNNT
jgi:carboxypeptidase C (cathepsin A)